MVERVFVVERIIWNEYNEYPKNLLYKGRSVVDAEYPEQEKTINKRRKSNKWNSSRNIILFKL